MTPQEFLSRFARVKKNGPNDWHVPCSGHDDDTQDPAKFSLHVTATSDRLLLRCFAGCPVETVLGRLGLAASDLFVQANGHARPEAGPPPTLAAFAARKRLEPEFLTDCGWSETTRGLAIRYRQRDGSTWRMRFRTSLEPGQGFIWDGQHGKAMVPYGRWRLDEWMERGELWLVEGESDAVTAWAHGLPCLGLPGNLAVKALEREDLVGIDTVWIVEEPGQSGRGFLEALRGRLRALGYQGLARVVRFEQKDLSDAHVAAGDRFDGMVWAVQTDARDLWAEEAAQGGALDPQTPDATELAYIEPIAVFLAEEDPPARWIFPELLPTDVLMLVHGEPRARKSLVGFELALSAATGTAPFSLDHLRPLEPIPVLYVQEEDARSLTRPRLRRLVLERCGATPPATLHVSVRRGINLDEPAWIARLTRDITRLGIRFLVLDAARRLSAKVDEGPTKVRELIVVLRRLVTETGVTIAVVHHDTKPPQVGLDQRRRSQRASGGDWFAACECPIHIERTSSTESLVFPQDYKFSVDPTPFTFTCEVDGRLVKALVGTTVSAEDAETAGVRGKLLFWLQSNGPASKSDLKNAQLGRWERLAPALDMLMKAGLVDSAPGRKKGSLRYFVVPAKEEQKA